MPTRPPDEHDRRSSRRPTVAETLARLGLSLAPGGAVLAEAVSFAPA